MLKQHEGIIVKLLGTMVTGRFLSLSTVALVLDSFICDIHGQLFRDNLQRTNE